MKLFETIETLEETVNSERYYSMFYDFNGLPQEEGITYS
jgi:hypothetical protein